MAKILRYLSIQGSLYFPGRKAILGIICTLLVTFQLYGQSRTVSGKVTASDDGSPLPGANVILKGTNNGTTTGANGDFTIEASSDNVLVISFVGYASKEITVGQLTTINVSLESDAGVLSEVIVIGYGAVKKTDLTGSVSLVSAEDLIKVSSSDVIQMMQGRVPGVAISTDGQPGASPSVRIRGQGTFGTGGTSAEPLYVVDGFPLVGNFNVTGDGFQPNANVSSIRDLNPNDIASITVLKDASAAAIYGVRAANGVVLITTKRGKFNQPLKVDINMYAGVQNVAKTIPVTNRVQYQELHRETFTNDGSPAALAAIASGNDPNSPNFIDNIDTDWQKEGLKSGGLQNYYVSLSGGGASNSFYVGIDHFKNTGTLVGNGPDYERTSIRFNSDAKLGKFKLGSNLFIGRSKEVSGLRVSGIPGANPPFVNDLVWGTPTIPVKDPSRVGGFGGSSNIQNALSMNAIGMNSLVKNEREITRALIGVYAEYEIIKDLTYKLNLGYDFSYQNNELFVPKYDFGFFFENANAYYEKAVATRTSELIENTLNYKKSLGRHNINLLGGITFQDFKSNGMGGRTSGLQEPYIPTLSNGTGTKSVSQGIDNSSLFSLLGRVEYNYDDRYFLTANLRRDGSSKFPENNRFEVFPSVAVAWKIHNDFQLPSFIRDLKLRAGYGKLGNLGIPSYASQPLLNSNVTYSFNDTRVFGAAAIAAVDPNLKWEVRTSRSVGLDIGMFKGLDFTVEYYSNLAEDVLVTVPLNLTVGAIPASVLTNAGAMKNSGIELSLNWRKTLGDFYFEVSPNFYTVKNEVTALGSNDYLVGASSRTVVGQSIGRPYGWVYDGIFQSQTEVDNGAFQNASTGPGDIRFKDLDDNGVINDNDRTFLAQAIPKAYYGLNLTANYKNFDFSFFGSGSAGAKAINSLYRGLMSSQSSGNTNYHEDILDRWTPTNTNTDIPRMIYLDRNLNGRDSDRPGWLQSTAYFRINSISVGYTLPKTVTDKLHMNKLRVYATTQNLHTFTKYKGFNPDFRGIDLLSPGWDFGTYPRPVTYMGGVQITF